LRPQNCGGVLKLFQIGTKMKKVVLFFPKLEPNKDFHYFPLSLLSISSLLVEQGIECLIIDERVNENFEQKLIEAMDGALCFGTTAFTGYQLARAYAALKLIKQKFPNIPVILGGQHITNTPDQTLKSDFIDIGVIGYGEYIFKELINRMIINQPIEEIEGVAYTDGEGNIKVNPPSRKFDVDILPSLPYQLIDIEKYVNPATKRFMYISSYGCPGICTFCATPNQRKWLPLPIERLKKDLNYLFNKYDFRQILFFDATLFTLPDRLVEIAELIKQYNISWIADGRALEMYRLDDEYIQKLIDSGLKQVTVGLETGSRHVAAIMKKGKEHLEKFETVARKLRKFDVALISGLIFGTPGETVADLKETIECIKKIKSINRNFRLSSTFFRPLPGTELFHDLKREGYPFPDDLEAWAKEGGNTHYKYNQWMDVPWFDEKTKQEYRKIYSQFIEEHQGILV